MPTYIVDQDQFDLLKKVERLLHSPAEHIPPDVASLLNTILGQIQCQPLRIWTDDSSGGWAGPVEVYKGSDRRSE